MKVFDLEAVLKLNNKDFEQKLDESEASGEEFGSKFEGTIERIKKALEVAAVATTVKKIGDSFMSAVQKTTQFADQIDKGAQKLNISYKSYQELDYAMGLSGATIDDLGVAVRNLNSYINDGATEDIATAMSALGVKSRDAEGNLRKTEDVLMDVIYALSEMEQTAERGDIVSTLFGRGGATLNAFLNSGREGIQEMVQEANDLGLVWSDEAIVQGAKTNDAMDKLNQVLEKLVFDIMTPFLPVVETLSNALTPILPVISSALQSIINPILKLAGIDPENQKYKQAVEAKYVEEAKRAPEGEELYAHLKGMLTEKGDKTQYDNIMNFLQANYKVTEKQSSDIASNFYKLAYHETMSGQKIRYAGTDEQWENNIKATLADLEAIETTSDKAFNAAAESAGTASASVQELAEQINALPSEKDITINMHVNGSANVGEVDVDANIPGFATGLSYVPYDEFPAILHEGEMVLTKSEASDYRRGGDAGVVDLFSLTNAIVMAVKQGMESANIQMDGETVTRHVNRRQAEDFMARRFANT